MLYKLLYTANKVLLLGTFLNFWGWDLFDLHLVESVEVELMDTEG